MSELAAAIDHTEGIDICAAVRNCRDLVNDAGSRFLVAEMAGEVVGFINFNVRQTVLHTGPSGLIDELVVRREHRGKGIGRRLMLAAIDECGRVGCCEVEVSTEKTNAEAREFYRRCGFEEGGVLLELDIPTDGHRADGVV